MFTEIRPESTQTKADRKTSARAANNPATYETTAFGRRRVSKVPRWLQKVGVALSIVGAFLLRFVRPNRPSAVQ